MKRYSFFLVVLCFLAFPRTMSANAPHDFSYSLWDDVLRSYVRDGKVNYEALRKDPAKLNAYLAHVTGARPDAFKTKNEKFAFWINAYNALTFRGVLRTLPEKPSDFKNYSVKKIWRFWTASNYEIGGKEYSLNAIENDILRPEFRDPRVHFTLVCASRSCPKLQSRAFHPQTLDKELDAAAREFVNNPEKVRVDLASRTLYLSSIFKWFHKDFERNGGSVSDFVLKYLDDGAQKDMVRRGNFKIKYLDYDWGLNYGT